MYNKCCIENCASKRQDVKLHQFPTSEIGLKKWLKCIGSVHLCSLSADDLRKVFVCHKHFERRFITATSRLRVGSYPTLFSESEIARGAPLIDSENEVDTYTEHDHCYPKKRKHEDHTYCKNTGAIPSRTSSSQVLMAIENLPQGPGSAESLPSVSHTSPRIDNPRLETIKETNVDLQHSALNISTPRRTKSSRKRLVHKVSQLSPKCKLLYKEYLLSKKQANFNKRAKRALKYAESESFEKLAANMNPLARKLFWMQIKLCTKKHEGRRFSMEEKIIALSIMKQSPKCYRFLQRIFILPTKNTINKMISSLTILPGMNPQIFETIKQEVSTWKETKRYCSILFDEVSLQTGLNYDKARDAINGFVELESKSNQFADHALAFMIRGAVHKWQQPIAFYFCEGSTNREQMKAILKNIVAAVVETGLLPVALICDQGSSFRSALGSLIEDTRREQIKAGQNTNGVISLSGQDLSVIYDPPHLLKGIRNNFLTKNIEHEGKISKWEDIVDVYKTDCNHAQARMLHKLNDRHVQPNNIDKMKVQNCTRVLSQTVASALSYTAEYSRYSDGREVSATLRNTAETVAFFDKLFDSCNGSSLRTRGKHLRRAVTRNSEHHVFWEEAINKIEQMKFVDKESGEATRASVPSLKNWVVTLKSLQRLWQFFVSKGLKIMRTRYFNSDPVENFFGQVRAYNFRNNDPDCHTFTATFRSLLITRFIQFHSKSFNCEESSEHEIIKIKNLFMQTAAHSACLSRQAEREITTTNFPNENVQLQEARRERLHVHSRAYTAGWLVRKILLKINCETCRNNLTTEEGSLHKWISHREYETVKKHKLTYPSEHAVRYFGIIVQNSNEYLEKEPHVNNISKKIRNKVLERYSFDFLTCEEHKALVTEYFVCLTIRFTIFNWCNTINKILKGTDVLRLSNVNNLPNMQLKALNKYKKN